MKKTKKLPPPTEQPFVTHLVELRDRLLKCVLVVVAVFLGLMSFSNNLYTFLAEPLIKSLPQGSTMIATGVISPFLTPFKLTLVVSVFVSVPFLLYQAWAFVAPGLYQNERRLAFPLIVSSTVLFYVGMMFAYYVVFPLVFGFMSATTPHGVAQTPDISLFLDFAIKMFFAFGVAFEVPIATILIIWMGLTTAESLAAKRPYVIVAAFVIGMLLTPPDVISQTLLALPMWFLFELGLIFSKMYQTKREDNTDKDTDDDSGSSNTSSKKTGADDANSDDDESVAEDYGDSEQAHGSPMSEAEMDAELDRIESEHDNPSPTEPHPEYEPLPEDDENNINPTQPPDTPRQS